MAEEISVTINDVKQAYERISPHIHKTPVFTSIQADARSGRTLFFKAENLQKIGAFKARGSLNAVLKTKETKSNINGFATYSSGNHGQGMAWSSRLAGFPCTVIVPKTASAAKKNAILGYGAELVECGPKVSDRYDTCDKVRLEKGLEVIPPFDHPDVIAGQGTIGLELLEQVPDLDAVLVPVSGGGMSSGLCVTIKAIKPDVKRKRPWEGPPQYLDTIADGLRIQPTGYITTPILIKYAEKEVFEVSDEDIVDGMKFVFERLKLVVEPSSATTVAAAFSEQFKSLDPSIRNVALILSGGNVELDKLPW